MDQTSNLKEISLLVFDIRKLRLLSTAPDVIKLIVDSKDSFNQMEERLNNIDQHPSEIQILLCDLFLLLSRSWEGFMEVEQQPRFILERISDLRGTISLSFYYWIRAYDQLSFDFYPIEQIKGFKSAQANLIKNRKIISQILKRKISLKTLNEFFDQTTFHHYSNMKLPFFGFSSLTRNAVYIATQFPFTDPDKKIIEAQLFDGFCNWLLRKTRTPLTIISEELKIFSKSGFHSEPSDVYMERVYHTYIYSNCPFKIFQFNSPRKM